MKDRILSRFRGNAAGDRSRRVPPGQRVYAIGDIHGCNRLLDSLLAQIELDVSGYGGTVTLVYLGDFIDRGLGTADVIECVRQPPKWAQRTVYLRGNHEEMILHFIDNPVEAASWCQYGGLETLASYGVNVAHKLQGSSLIYARDELAERMPPAHLAFLCDLELSKRIGDVFFCHAGIDPETPLSEQIADALLWIREPFLSSKQDFGAYVVHGHTPTEAPQVRANRLNIDTGAYLSGCLTCAVFEECEVRFLSTGRQFEAAEVGVAR